jgi:hypothetical protein
MSGCGRGKKLKKVTERVAGESWASVANSLVSGGVSTRD